MGQGALGDAWLVSALNMLRSFPESLKKIIVSDRHSDRGTAQKMITTSKPKHKEAKSAQMETIPSMTLFCVVAFSCWSSPPLRILLEQAWKSD